MPKSPGISTNPPFLNYRPDLHLVSKMDEQQIGSRRNSLPRPGNIYYHLDITPDYHVLFL